MIADPRPVSFSIFLGQIARIRFDRMPWRLPIPLAPIFHVERLAGAVGLRLEFARRLKSLSELPILDSATDMRLLNLPIRRFPAGLDRSGRSRKALLREGAILMRYLLNAKPNYRLIRRYVCALQALGETQRLQIGLFPRLLPSLLSVFDQPAARRRAGSDDAFSRRTDLALLLAESSTRHVDGFLLSYSFASRLAQVGSVVVAILGDAVARIIDLVGGRIWLDRIRPRAIKADTDDL
jgi:NADH dehydrogenase